MPEIKVHLPEEHTGPNHPAIHLSITRQDSILWTCDSDDFEVLDIRKDPSAPAHYNNPNAPDNPFYREFGKGKAKAEKRGCVCSGPVRIEAEEQQYKLTYSVGKVTHDPHIITPR